MATDLNKTPVQEKPPSFGIGKIIFVIVLAVIFFLLAKAWCIIASLEAAKSTGTAPSNHSKPLKEVLVAAPNPSEQRGKKAEARADVRA